MRWPSFHFKSNILHYFFSSDLGQLYLHSAILSFAGGLIGIFVPVYLFTAGYSLLQIIFYYLLYWAIISLSSPIAMLINHRIGLKHAILLSLPLKIAILVGFIFVESNPLLFYALAILTGLHVALYFVPLHSLFARVSHTRSRGSEVGTIHAINHVSGLVAPVLGGLVIITFGWNVLFMLAILLVFVSGIPLLLTKDVYSESTFSLARMVSKENLSYMVAFVAEGGVGAVGELMWPLFIFITLESVLSLGFVATFTQLGLIIFTLYIGYLTDVTPKLKLVNLGGLLGAITWVVRPFATSALKVFGIGFLDGMVGVLRNVPFTTIFYEKAMIEHLDEFIVFREFALGVGRLLFVGVILLFSDTFTAAFMLAGIGSLVFAFFKEEPVKR